MSLVTRRVVSLRHEIPVAIGLGVDIGQTQELGASVVNDPKQNCRSPATYPRAASLSWHVEIG